MPKNKRKGKSGGLSIGKLRSDIMGTSDEDSMNDNASIISIASESTVMDEVAGDEVDEQSQDDAFEDKMCEAIDGITQKAAQGRTNSLDLISQALSRKYIPEFLIGRLFTLCDGIERCLKRGRGSEQASAANLAALLCVQLGVGDLIDQVRQNLQPLLTCTILDKTASPTVRAKCCWTLALLGFLDMDRDNLAEFHQTLLSVYNASFAKGDGTPASVSVELASLHAAALSSWSLLLTIINIHSFTEPTLSQMSEMLDSPHLDVRMAAGEVIALLMERGRQYDDNYEWEASDELIEKLRQLATDSHKYRAKKDRKTQRSSFRDILKYVEDDQPPNFQVRFGQETLCLDSWCRKKQYDAFCQILGSGMNLHLTENDLLRDVFELGEKLVPLNMAAHKQSKIERHLMNQANFKARCVSRAKNRDKRSAVFAS